MTALNMQRWDDSTKYATMGWRRICNDGMAALNMQRWDGSIKYMQQWDGKEQQWDGEEMAALNMQICNNGMAKNM